MSELLGWLFDDDGRTRRMRTVLYPILFTVLVVAGLLAFSPIVGAAITGTGTVGALVCLVIRRIAKRPGSGAP